MLLSVHQTDVSRTPEQLKKAKEESHKILASLPPSLRAGFDHTVIVDPPQIASGDTGTQNEGGREPKKYPVMANPWDL
jgi:hypothetical protein